MPSILLGTQLLINTYSKQLNNFQTDGFQYLYVHFLVARALLLQLHHTEDSEMESFK